MSMWQPARPGLRPAAHGGPAAAAAAAVPAAPPVVQTPPPLAQYGGMSRLKRAELEAINSKLTVHTESVGRTSAVIEFYMRAMCMNLSAKEDQTKCIPPRNLEMHEQ